MSARNPRKRARVAPALDLSSGLGFPFRQEINWPTGARDRAETTARAVLGEAGFDLVQRSGPAEVAGEPPTPGSTTWVGERGLRRRGVTSSTAVIPIIAVFVAGSILGGLDAYIVGSPVIGIFWVLGAAATSGIFWLRYGGTYDSDVVLLTVSPSLVRTEATAGTVAIVFGAARVRSQIRSDLRVASVVSGPLKLAAELGMLVREFRRRMSASSDGMSATARASR